jgi:hypothetical protein
MKVYVFGGDRDACIELANQLNESGASAIIAAPGEELKNVAGRIGKAFDRAVMVSDDPIRDSISANRDARVKAAPCYSQKVLKSAASSDVNLFILEKDACDRLDVSDILGSPASARQPPAQKERKEERREDRERKEEKERAEKERREEPQRREQKRQQPDPEPIPEDEGRERGKGGGVGGKLKDIFGIVDE